MQNLTIEQRSARASLAASRRPKLVCPSCLHGKDKDSVASAMLARGIESVFPLMAGASDNKSKRT